MVAIGFWTCGCAQLEVLPIPVGWPAEIEGRELYHTSIALIYARDARGAAWMDDYLKARLAQIEDRFAIKLPPGVVVVVGPGDPPMDALSAWPSYSPGELPGFVELPVTDPRAFLGGRAPARDKRRWVCAVPTDAYFHEVVSAAYRAEDSERWREPLEALACTLTQWPFLLLRPAARKVYVGRWDVHREWALARAAVDRAGLSAKDNEAIHARMTDHYLKELDQVERRHGRLLAR